MSEKIKEVKLFEFVENPDNPQTVTDRAFERLVGKLKRVPAGLTAKRIGYVTDHPAGKYVVLSGNKRLRALKVLRGTDGTAPAEWFQDITEMSEDQRREFIVAANICEGKWVAELLLAIVPKDELKDLMDDQDVMAILAEIPSNQQIAENQEIAEGEFADEMDLKLKLKAEDRDEALGVLNGIDPEDTGKALMEIVKEYEK